MLGGLLESGNRGTTVELAHHGARGRIPRGELPDSKRTGTCRLPPASYRVSRGLHAVRALVRAQRSTSGVPIVTAASRGRDESPRSPGRQKKSPRPPCDRGLGSIACRKVGCSSLRRRSISPRRGDSRRNPRAPETRTNRASDVYDPANIGSAPSARIAEHRLADERYGAFRRTGPRPARCAARPRPPPRCVG